MPSSQNGSIKSIKSWLKRYSDKMLDDPDNRIIAIGLGKKSTGALDDDSPFCVTGFVEEKLPKRQLKARGITDFASSFAAVSRDGPAAEGIEIDLVEAGSAFTPQPGLRIPTSQRGAYGGPLPNVDLQKRFDRLRAGLGLTNPENTYPNFLSVGTLGFFVTDPDDTLYLVSNNHVIAEGNAATAGDSIVQPGTLDLTSTELSMMPNLTSLRRNLKIGELSAWIDIRYHSAGLTPLNDVDCAIAEVHRNARSVNEAARVGLGGANRGLGPQYSVNDNGEVRGSTRVYKAGRTTGWTEGDVVAINVVTDVQYQSGLARFRNQLAIRASSDNGGPFSDKGDSGSGIFNAEHKLVALLFAGSETRTLANPIRPVLKDLEAKLGQGRLTLVSG